MEFRLLGPLEVWGAGQALQLRGSKRRAVLALLALHANEVVRSERLIDELWGERPPANAQAALQNHISRLRKELGAELLVTKPWGYVLRVEPNAIDLRRFEAQVAEAKSLPAAERRERLVDALALWRGPALADLTNEQALKVERARLDELRLAALEQRLDAELELGTHEQLVPELEALVGEHPLRERLRGQLILALYRSGRQAEALETYRETRRVLVEELGIEPSPELRELERAILRQDPALVSAPRVVPSEARPPDERWRWPRSPLALGVGLLALAVAGAALAALLSRGGASSRDATPAAVAAAAGVPTFAPTSAQTHAVARPDQAAHPATTATAGRPKGGTTTASLVHHAVHVTTRPQTPLDTTTSGPPPPSPPASPPPPPPPPPTPPAPPVHVLYRLRDDFSGDSMNKSLWRQSTLGSGIDLSQPLGWLEVRVAADAAPDGQYDAIEGKYESTCTLHSDFDARLDYVLLDWPVPSGVVVGLSAFSYSGPPYLAAEIKRASEALDPQGEYYFGWVSPRHGADLPLSDLSGSLRMTRVNGLLTEWFWRSGRWVKLVSARVKDPLTLALRVDTNGDEFRHAPVRIALDNFVVTANQFSCPLGTKPQRL